MPLSTFAGKTVVVTGGASGIGFALAEAFGTRGARVAIADVEEEPLAGAVRRLRERGIETLGVMTDVSDLASVRNLQAAVHREHGAVDVLCNNAGVGPGGITWEVPGEVWEWVLGVDLWGVIHGIQTFVPAMVERGEGHVVNTASVAGLMASPGMGPYAAAKHAVVGLSEALRQDLERSGTSVGVTVVCPSMTRTQMNDSGRNWPARLGAPPSTGLAPGHPETRQSYSDRMRSAMDPSEVARRTLEAIRDGEFWVVLDADFEERFRLYAEGIVAGVRIQRSKKEEQDGEEG